MNCLRKGKPRASSPYWIRHRKSSHSEFFVPLGQCLVSRIQALEKKADGLPYTTIYLRFPTKEAYRAEIARLTSLGHRIY